MFMQTIFHQENISLSFFVPSQGELLLRQCMLELITKIFIPSGPYNFLLQEKERF
jgi:hypothetical protein